MKRFCLFLLILICTLPAYKIFAQEKYTFRVTTGEKIHYEILILKTTQQGIIFKTPISVNRYDSNDNQLIWKVTQTAEGTSVKAQRFGNTIQLRGTFRRQPVSKTYAIDSRPWYQYPEVTLKGFVLSAKQRMEFWIISPDDLNIFEFEAVKMGMETIEISGRSVKTIRIRIKALGFAGNFWHADYWFAIVDGSYLRYQAVHGGPGTPPTIKEFME
jgi:hypothetical protein